MVLWVLGSMARTLTILCPWRPDRNRKYFAKNCIMGAQLRPPLRPLGITVPCYWRGFSEALKSWHCEVLGVSVSRTAVRTFECWIIFHILYAIAAAFRLWRVCILWWHAFFPTAKLPFAVEKLLLVATNSAPLDRFVGEPAKHASLGNHWVPIEGIPWNSSEHHNTMVLRGLRGNLNRYPIMPRDAYLSNSKFF